MVHTNPNRSTAFLQLYTAGNRYGREFSCFVSLWALVTDKHFLRPECCYQTMYCFIPYFLVRIRITKCYTNSGKRVRCEVALENKRTFLYRIHYDRTCTSFEQRPSNQGNLHSSVTGEVARVYYTEITRFWLNFCSAARDCFGVALQMAWVVGVVSGLAGRTEKCLFWRTYNEAVQPLIPILTVLQSSLHTFSLKFLNRLRTLEPQGS
jgi:hypothetical protein